MKLRRLAVLAIVAAGLASTWGCDKPVQLLAPNQRPVVRITGAPLDSTQRNYYVITLDWIGFDPDGRVDHFLLAFDPPTVAGTDTAWETTTDHSRTRSFPCPLPDRPDSTLSSDFHVFVVKAVDNLGAISTPVARAFWSYTLAPRVEMRVPPARALVTYYLPPGVLLSWEGFDDDGVFTQKPVKYKFILLDESTEVKLSIANQTPDAVRQYYAPRNWAGWDSLPGDTTQKQYTNLTPDKMYMFVVVAFDEAGAYSPIFNRDNNMVLFKVTYAGAQNPRIGIFNDFFLYEYDQGSNRPGDPSQIVHVEVPAADPRNPDDKLTFNWYASPVRDSRGNPISGPIRSYRWAVDMTDTEDETQRSNEDTDLSHWSQKSTLITSCRIGPYVGRQTHMFLIQAEDINGLRSLGQVEFTTAPATFEKPLLVVDDTRYLIDGIAPNTNCYSPSNRPKQDWPTQAELDTFLYARGGVQWRCYPLENGQPVLSTPGIFNGYDFDTVGTNTGVNDLTVRLSGLGKYRHVIWLVDRLGSLNNGRGTDLTSAMTALRYMNNNGRTNTLAAYVRQGGRVWLVGNAATASMINFNNGNNDNKPPVPYTLTFSNDPAMRELVPGRFMYNQAHWRSEFKQFILYNGRVKRYLGRFEGAPGIYAGLPPEISMKSSATDPFPPNRANSPAVFYQPQFAAEFLTAPNDILEDLDPGQHEDFESTLDTLYKVTAASLQPDTGRSAVQNVVMTRYHGLDNQEFLVTGFPVWNFQRSQCQALVDFVLGELWGVFPHAPAAAGAPVRAPNPAAAATLAGGRGRPTPLRPRR